jgi:hypothetical protein
MRTFELPAETQAATGFTHKTVISHNALVEAADNTAQTLTLLTAPANSIIKDAALFLPTPFQRTGTTAYNSNTIVVGIAGTTNQLLASTQINANNGTPVTAARFNSNTPIVYTSATPIIATVASMASYDLAELDAGEVEIFLSLVPLAQY